MKKMSLLFIGLAALAAGCSKTGSNNQPTGTFQPVTSGSNWSYSVTEVLNPSSSLLLTAAATQLGMHFPNIDTSFTMNVTVTGSDTTIGGLSYAMLATDTVRANDILSASQGTSYYGLGIIPEFNIAGLGGTVSNQPLLYLKDAAVGTTWSQNVVGPGPQPGTTDTSSYTFTIDAVNQSMTVGGVTFHGVTKETVKVLPGGVSAFASMPGLAGTDLSISGDYYFARNVGPIEVSVNSALYGFQYTEMLTSYTIK